MGTALLKIKLMPESVETDLEVIETEAKNLIEQEKGENPKFERVAIAFGLTAIHVSFAMDESLPTDIFEEKLRAIPHVNSAEIIDFRRAFG